MRALVWSAIGLGLTVLGAAAALVRAHRGDLPGYDAEGYGMTARSHLRFAWLSAAFAALFGLSFGVHALPAPVVLAAYTLALALYASSFARGASH
jgi:hypothetical protein